MILDTLASSSAYLALHPLFAPAFEFLRATDLRALAPGRHAIDGDRLFVSMDHVEGRGRASARLEAHRRYIDIQVIVDGFEEIGWRPLAACTAAAPFDPGRDIGFFDDPPETWLALPSGHFAVFFPDDAHAPLAGKGPLVKAVVKVSTQAR